MEDKIMKKSTIRSHLFCLLTFVCLAATQTALAHGISDADRAAMLEGGYARYIGLGASHMLTGYDHLLFLFGVMFFLYKFKDVAKFITAFTLGHCITLIGATFMKISMNYFMIDALIALTVVYKGFDNLDGFKRWLNMKSPNMLRLVFIFGLIHGFGLSTRLQQLPLGDDALGLFLRIISFNIGVEVGQIAALSVMLLVLAGWRKTASFAKFSGVANAGLIVCGILLFLMQMHGFMHESEPSQEVESPAVTSEQGINEGLQWSEPVTLTVPPGSGLEHKFRVSEGRELQYSWSSDGGDLFYDLHGEPEGAPANEFVSFEKGTKGSSKGSVVPPFTGTLGWYWANKGVDPVAVTVKVRGNVQTKNQ